MKGKAIINQKLLEFLWLVIICVGLTYSCNDKEQVEEEELIEEDCFYQFSEGIDDIYGAWEPKIIIDYETGDSTFYDIGTGPQGFMLETIYFDSYELRDNGEFDLYYVSSGRPCKEEMGGTWVYEKDSLTFTLVYLGDTMISIPVLSITEKELIIEDIINFKESKAIMRKVN